MSFWPAAEAGRGRCNVVLGIEDDDEDEHENDKAGGHVCYIRFDRAGSGVHNGGVNQETGRGRLCWWLGLAAALFTFRVGAGVQVGVSFFTGFSLDPVNIVAGETVYWFANDGYGPYAIISDSNFWTPFETDAGTQFNQAGTFHYHDDVGDSGTIIVTTNAPPTVVITNPVNNAVFYAPASFNFAVTASDTDADGLEDVEFYVGTNLVGTVLGAPFTASVTNLPLGSYTLTAIARDNVGATATNSIAISVENPPPTLSAAKATAGMFMFNVNGLIAGKTNILQTTTNLSSPASWVSLSTNVAAAPSASFTNSLSPGRGFFRVVQWPWP